LNPVEYGVLLTAVKFGYTTGTVFGDFADKILIFSFKALNADVNASVYLSLEIWPLNWVITSL